jgi:hypothetical protein
LYVFLSDKMGGGDHWPMRPAIRSRRRRQTPYYRWWAAAHVKAKAMLHGSSASSASLSALPFGVKYTHEVQKLAKKLLQMKINAVRLRQQERRAVAIDTFNRNQLPFLSVPIQQTQIEQIPFSWMFV